MDREIALQDLLARLFSADDLHLYALELPDGRAIRNELLPATRALTDVVQSFLQATVSKRGLHEDVFALCRRHRPRRAAGDIEPVAALWHSDLPPGRPRRKGPFDFFIAYSGPDEPRARELWRLLSPHADTFFDRESLRPGDRWDERIPEAIDATRILVALLSPGSKQGWYHREEIAAGVDRVRRHPARQRLAPVYLGALKAGHADIPYGLRVMADLREADEHGGLAGVAEKLLATLKTMDEEEEAAEALLEG